MKKITKYSQRYWGLALVAVGAQALIAACGGRGSVNVDMPNDVYPNPGNTLTPTAAPGTATNTPVPTATNTNTPVPTATNTNTPVPTATNTNTPVPTATNTNTPVPTATNTNTPVPTATNTNTPIPTSTVTNTPTPTATPTGVTVSYSKFTTGAADASAVSNVAATFTQNGASKTLVFQAPESLQLNTTDDFNQVNFSGVTPLSKGLTRFGDAKLIAYCPNDSVERFAAVYIDTNSLIAFDASTPAGRQEMVGKTFRFTNCQNPNFVYPSDSFTFNADGTATDIFDDEGTPVTETLSVADLNAVFGATGMTDAEGSHYITAYRYQRPDNGYDYVLLNKQVQAGVANFLLVLPN